MKCGHRIVKGNCGHVIEQCRCPDKGKRVHFLAEPCTACKRARGMDLEPLSPLPQEDPPRFPTL